MECLNAISDSADVDIGNLGANLAGLIRVIVVVGGENRFENRVLSLPI